MEIGQRLSDRLKTINLYGQEDLDWYHFVRDHKKYIIRHSKVEKFTPEEMVKYRYRPQEFIVDKCRAPIGYTWIFLFINDIRDPADFNESCTNLYMLPTLTINTMYQRYKTSANRERDVS